jgi:hypothetical protein
VTKSHRKVILGPTIAILIGDEDSYQKEYQLPEKGMKNNL